MTTICAILILKPGILFERDRNKIYSHFKHIYFYVLHSMIPRVYIMFLYQIYFILSFVWWHILLLTRDTALRSLVMDSKMRENKCLSRIFLHFFQVKMTANKSLKIFFSMVCYFWDKCRKRYKSRNNLIWRSWLKYNIYKDGKKIMKKTRH